MLRWALLGWWLLVSPCQAQILTLEEALRQASQSHPQVQAAQRRLEGYRLRAKTAGAQPNPTLRFGETAGEPIEEVNNFTQRLEVSGQPGLRARLAEEEAAAKEGELGAARLLILSEAAESYLELWAALEKRNVLQRRYDLNSQLEAISRRRFEVGDIPKNQHLRVQLETARAAADLASSEADARNGQARLSQVLGRPAPFELSPDPLEGAIQPPVPDSLEAALQSAGVLPAVQVAEKTLEAARLRTELARKEGSPELGFMLYRSSLARTESVQGFQLTLSFTPWDWGQIASEVAVREGEQKALEAELELSRRQSRLRIEKAWNNLEGARRRRDALLTQVSQYLHLAQMAQKGYESGYWSLQDTLDAQRTYRDALLDYNNAVAAQALARLELSWLTSQRPQWSEHVQENP